MARPRQNRRVIQLGASVSRDVKNRLTKFVGRGLKNQAVEEAIDEYLRHRQNPRMICYEIDDETFQALDRYRGEEFRHEPPRANVGRDALRVLLRLKNDSEPGSFIVQLTDSSLIDRIEAYRISHDCGHSSLAQHALRFYLDHGARRRPPKEQS